MLEAAPVICVLRVFIKIQGLGLMLLPLIPAVARVEFAGPPLVARRAPGLREFLNCCPFMDAAGSETGVERWLLVLFGTVGALDPAGARPALFPDASARRL
jgi:hypothetical protein